MPPTTQSSRIAKPEGMSLTWKPRLVKTPTPTMSATTIAAATQRETVEPLLSVRPPGKAAPPASDAAISVHALRASRPRFASMVQARTHQFKQRQQRFTSNLDFGNLIPKIRLHCGCGRLLQCERRWRLPQSGHDSVFRFRCPDGEFSGFLNVA